MGLEVEGLLDVDHEWPALVAVTGSGREEVGGPLQGCQASRPAAPHLRDLVGPSAGAFTTCAARTSWSRDCRSQSLPLRRMEFCGKR